MVLALRFSVATMALGLVALGSSFESGSDYRTWGPYPPVAPFTKSPLPTQRVVCPMIFPVIGKVHFKNSYNVYRAGFRHTAVDIAAPKMSPIVAPISGIIGFKRQTFWIYGDNGWSVLGTHLNDDNVGRNDARGSRDVMFAPDLKPGQHVMAGRLIGYVGDSGWATGPHLHFELFAPGKHLRNPFASLKYAQKLQAPRIFLPNKSSKPEKGKVRYAGCIRKLDPDNRRMTLLLTAVQESSGKTRAVSKVKYMQVGATDDAVLDAGGWLRLSDLPEEAVVSAYVDEKPGDAGYVAEQLSVDSDGY